MEEKNNKSIEEAVANLSLENMALTKNELKIVREALENNTDSTKVAKQIIDNYQKSKETNNGRKI